jgi:hypothetical protein
MPRNDHAALIAEIGSITTRVTLVDIVAGEARLINHVEVPSTIEPPQEDATIAILAAAVEIGEMTSRRLIEGGRLLMPQSNEGDGIDQLVALTSASGLMSVVIAAIAADISGRSAHQATLATYTSVLQTITLDNSIRTDEGRDTSWIERQVQLLTGLQPHVVLIAGGLDDGAQDSLIRLAHIIGLTSLSTRVTSEGTQEQSVMARPVIFAGNNQARERVIEALSGRARLKIVDNLRPTLEDERLEPTRRELMALYNEQILPRLPGWSALTRLVHSPVQTSAVASGLMTRFLAELTNRNVLAVNIGSSATTLHCIGADGDTPIILGNTGTGLGIGTLLAESGPAAIARWLPFPISERNLTHQLLNKMLRPQLHPATRDDLLLEHAAAREALRLANAALLNERPNAVYDLVIAGGGVLEHVPHPGLAALIILDALQPSAKKSLLAVDLHLDTLGLLAACGALATTNPDAALSLFERDLLSNTPLATCVVALGDGQPGTAAVEAELRVSGRAPIQITVAHGQIGRLPLDPGERGQLIIRPTSGVRVGQNQPGAEVASEVGALVGSWLGVIIDARGRPLRLPEGTAERQQLLWDWMVALGAESGPLPYETTAPAAELAPPILPPFIPATEAEAPPGADLAPSLDSDFVRLRQTVEEPKKRGGGLRRK